MLFVDFSSAFNTVIPSKLITKLGDLGISPSLCTWIMDFLTNRPQNVRSGHNCSTTITVNTGTPQGCVLSPFLYSLFTHDCKPVYGSNSIIKFADDTTVIGLISDNDESDYRAEVEHLAAWCADNNLLLNTSKTKELIVDFRKEKSMPHDPIHINGMAVERVSSFKFLGTHISENLSWSTNTSSLIKKAHQRLFFLRTLKKNRLSADILSNFYRCAIESILTNCITVWYGNCSVADRKALQRVVKTTQRITKTPLPAIEVVQKKRCLRRARNILKDSSHPAHSLFQLLPSRRRYRSLKTKTSRFRNSFFPTAINGCKLENLCHSAAVELFRSAGEEVTLHIQQRPPHSANGPLGSRPDGDSSSSMSSLALLGVFLAAVAITAFVLYRRPGGFRRHTSF
ncbi:hypothetical protein PGIGA_G00103570 [Pangasianodon gigas]|uniref:Uncharacterized protein n=1 Tax=Pangasianodon gigas TaxID=30993 RepID=A0ACC5XGY8_PANGG|nr:hypothetical protein [Pangasianodon gigas]